jgi:hypothetical protein
MAAYDVGRLLGSFVIFPLILLLLIGTIYYFIKQRRISFSKAIFNPIVIGATVLLSLASLVGNVNSSSQQDASHSYPERDVSEFTEGCVESASERLGSEMAQKICSCAISEIQKNYTYGEFKKLGQEMQQTKAAPTKFEAAFSSCAQKQS